jgi:hypothetical protein
LPMNFLPAAQLKSLGILPPGAVSVMHAATTCVHACVRVCGRWGCVQGRACRSQVPTRQVSGTHGMRSKAAGAPARSLPLASQTT